MNLDELLSYNPHKKTGTKRGREEEKGVNNLPSKAPRPRLKGGAVGSVGHQQQVVPPSVQQTSELQPGVAAGTGLNGVSDEEKLRLLQSMEDEDDSTGRYHT